MLLGNLGKNILFKSRHVRFNFFNNYNTSSSDITAGVLIIGDEILKGHTQDTNSSFLIKKLNLAGLKICKIAVLPDDVNVISEEVSALSEKCTVVLTSGGIGPTHDDVTYEAVAKAYGEELALNAKLSNLFKEYFGPKAEQNPAVIKFSSIPQSAKLNFGIDKYGKNTKFPLVSVRNIYMLPGVPMLLEKSFDVFKTNFLLHNKPHYVESIFLALDEFSVTPVLNNAVKLFDGQVKFGSYPSFGENYFKVKLILESTDKNRINAACDYFKHELPDGSVVSLKDDLSLKEDLLALCENHDPFRWALSVVDQALEKYSTSELCICFNGGKDCTALLHLVYCCVLNRKSTDSSQMQALYVKNGETFREVDDFIHACVKRYNLNLITMTGDLRESFESFLQTHPHIKAMFMGSRKGDPGAESMEYFCQTDKNWPSIMRISPILNWSYTDVWNFIRNLQVPYCTLYDRGYTSLGNKSHTVQNPALLVSRHKGFQSYKPAYLLEDFKNERNGRVK